MAEPPHDKSPGPKGAIAEPMRDVPVKAKELPVVARLVVEVRSDGSRTVARGAMEDAASGLTATIQASGNTPVELALSLMKNVLGAPWFARELLRSSVLALARKALGADKPRLRRLRKGRP